MSMPYFNESPPKSTGREQFGRKLVADLTSRNFQPYDLIATVTAFTAESIAGSIRSWILPKMPVDQLIVSGGGSHNPEIMGRLSDLLPETEVVLANTLGPSENAKEATAFAILAYETFHRRPANIPSATGAAKNCVLGKLSWPPSRF